MLVNRHIERAKKSPVDLVPDISASDIHSSRVIRPLSHYSLDPYRVTLYGLGRQTRSLTVET